MFLLQQTPRPPQCPGDSADPRAAARADRSALRRCVSFHEPGKPPDVGVAVVPVGGDAVAAVLREEPDLVRPVADLLVVLAAGRRRPA